MVNFLEIGVCKVGVRSGLADFIFFSLVFLVVSSVHDVPSCSGPPSPGLGPRPGALPSATPLVMNHGLLVKDPEV